MPIDKLVEVIMTTVWVTLLAVCFGILFDALSVTVCIEYLRDHHPYIGTRNPFLLAIGWGILATWWFGTSAGILFGTLNQLGSWPRLERGQINWLVSKALGFQLIMTLPLHFIAYFLDFVVYYSDPRYELVGRIAATRHVHFLSYWISLVSTCVICGVIVIRRRKLSIASRL